MVRPQIAVPVHGEARHLIAHAELAGECQVQQPLVIQNGDMVRLAASGASIIDEVPVGRLASDRVGFSVVLSLLGKPNMYSARYSMYCS